MNYIEQTKSEGEEILAYFNINQWAYLGIYLQGIIALLIIGLSFTLKIDFSELKDIVSPDMIYKIFRFMGLIVLGRTIFSYLMLNSINMGVTDQRIAFKKGIVSRDTNEIRLGAVETVEVEQSVLGRLLGFGNVRITGKGEALIIFKDIDNPLVVKRDLASVLNHYT